MLGDASIVDPAQRPRQVGGEDEPHRDRLAVRDPVIGGGLQGVGQRVAVVEQGTTTALALVRRHHLRLDLDAPGDPLLVVECEQVVTRQEVVLRHLAVTAAHLTRREGGQRIQVADDGTRLPERSDEVLALGKVDARLASDGGIDHRQQRCRDVDDRHTAVPRRGREPRHVGHHPPADADHAVVAGETEPGEGATQRLDRRQGLELLARADRDHLVGHTGIDHERDGRLGDDDSPTGRARQHVGELVPGARADQHVVRPIGERHGDPDHRNTASTTSLTERPSTSTIASATSR